MANVVTGGLAGRHRQHLSASIVIEALRRTGMSENLAQLRGRR